MGEIEGLSSKQGKIAKKKRDMRFWRDFFLIFVASPYSQKGGWEIGKREGGVEFQAFQP